MREKLTSAGMVISLAALACLFTLHLLVIEQIGSAVKTLFESIGGWLVRHQLTGSDLIALLGAIGTLAAVVVALRLATATQRRADREALVRAQFAAASVAARLEITHNRVWTHLAAGVFLSDSMSGHLARIKALDRIRREIVKTNFRPSDETLLALTPLPNSCAHRIARAYDLIECVRIDMATIPAGEIFATMSEYAVTTLLSRSVANLQGADQLLKVALQECRLATEAGAPMPTSIEVYGEPSDDEPW